MPRMTVRAPTGGWNARDSIDMMAETDAITLDNYYPGDANVQARKGFTSHRAVGLLQLAQETEDPLLQENADNLLLEQTSTTPNVETLMTYGGTTPEMFAIAGSNIFDVTATTDGLDVVTGLTNAQWQYENFGTAGGHFIWLCNGADAPLHYNGATWANPSLTGVTAADIVNVMSHKRRLFFCFNDSLAFGYLPVVSVAGAVTEFDLASLFTLGGKLMAMGSWTRDGGSGTDDLACFITDNGEVAIYAGTDPGTSWSLVGIFQIGRPIGRRCLLKVGADLVVITDAGFVNLSSVLPTGLSAPSLALSNKIENAVREATTLHKAPFGWQAVLYPQGGYGLFNIPVSSAGDFHQYVVNLTTGAWCRFKGQDAYSWVVHRGKIYFGGDGAVLQADNGFNDNGAMIEAFGKTAFQYFGARGVVKKFTMLRPVMGSNAALAVSIGFDVDYAEGTSFFTPGAVASPGAEWDVAEWDVAEWATGPGTIQAWRTVQGIGYNSSVRIKTSTTAQNVEWFAADIIYELGTGLN